MGRIIELSKIKLNTDFTSVLVYLFEQNKPVLIEVPANINVWVTYKGDKSLFRRNLRTTRGLNAHTRFKGKPNVVKPVFDAHLIKHASYVQLKKEDLNLLLKQRRCSVRNPLAILFFDSNGDIEILDGKGCQTEYLRQKQGSMTEFDMFIARNSIEVEFVFSAKSVNEWKENNCIENEFKDLKASVDSVYVYEMDVVKFIVEDVDKKTSIRDIPIDSPYYIDDMLRKQSDLDELSILGFRYYWGKTAKLPKAKGLVELIMNQLGYAQKKAEAAAFFLNPNPDGRCGKTKSIADGCQFPYLTHCLEHFWHHKQAYDKNITSEIQKFLEGSEGEGFSSDNAKYAELILRPREFLRAPKKRI
ncbi:cytoplasmic protein [Shewanella baltica]|uniref:cytoplasmic protein n=1 Tax=Shewanella baltica TaxID=62322 RepID=UPI003D06A930